MSDAPSHIKRFKLRPDVLIPVICLTVSLLGAGFVFWGDIFDPPGELKVTLVSDGIPSEYFTGETTVGAFLEENGIVAGPHDYVEPVLSAVLAYGMVVKYKPSYAVLIADAGKSPETLYTTADSVCELLDERGVITGPFDRIVPHPSTSLSKGLKIEITRVEIIDITSEREIEPPLVLEADPDLRRGHLEEIEPGIPGIEEEVTRIYYRNGEESTRINVGSRTVVEPVARFARVGTMSLPNLASRSANFSRNVMSMNSTAYDPGPLSCAPFADGFTATGHRAGHGVAAVDPSVIPLGTELWVEGYGYALACDTGGAIKGNRIDLCFDTRSEALNWGRRDVIVYILN